MLHALVNRIAIRCFCPLARFFKNPHHLSGVVFAMLLTNTATLLWAILVLAQRDVLLRTRSAYAVVARHIDENILAAAFGLIALAHLLCLWFHIKPTRFRNVGYFVFAMAWAFVFFYNVTNRPLVYPTATSLSFAMAFAAFYAWLDGYDHGDA